VIGWVAYKVEGCKFLWRFFLVL